MRPTTTAFPLALALTCWLSSPPLTAQGDSQALVDKGYELIEKQRFAPAVKKLEKAIESDSDSFDAHFGIAVACTSLGELAKAVEHARRAADLAASPEQSVHAHNQLGLASFQHLQAEIRKEIAGRGSSRRGSTGNALAPRDWSVAEGAFRRVLELDEKRFPVARLSLAQVLGYQRRYDEALAELAAWQSTRPPAPPPHIQKAIDNLGCQGRLSRQNPGGQLAEISPRHPGISEPKKLSSPGPKYTEMGLKERVEGLVAFEAVIDRQGDVACAQVIIGQPHGLSESAEEAVRGWKFEPALRDGEPVAVVYYLTVPFRLAKIRKAEDIAFD